MPKVFRKKYRRSRALFGSQAAALADVVRKTPGLTADDLQPHDTDTHWTFQVAGKPTEPSGLKPSPQHSSLTAEQQSIAADGYINLSIEIIRSACRAIEANLSTPETPETPDAIESLEFLYLETSPVHQILGVNRQTIDSILQRIHNGEPVHVASGTGQAVDVSPANLDRVMRMTHGHVEDAAAVLGISSVHTRRLLKRHGLDLQSYRNAA